MRRIGFAASKIAKGHLLKYNISVVLIAFICGIFLFVLCGALTMFSIFIIVRLMQWICPECPKMGWVALTQYCLIVLSGIIGFLVFSGIVKNIRLRKPRL